MSTTITTQTPNNVEEIDLLTYLNYLAKLKTRPRSPRTIELYRQSLTATKLSKIKRNEINNVWPYLRKLLASKQAGSIFVEKTKVVIRGALKLYGIAHEPTMDYNLLLAELGNNNEPVEEYSDDDIRSILEISFARDTDLFNACVLGPDLVSNAADILNIILGYGREHGVELSPARVGNILKKKGIEKRRARIAGTKNGFCCRYFGIALQCA